MTTRPATIMPAVPFASQADRERASSVMRLIMADGPSTGGYPKIGAVTSADLPLLVQGVPNQSRIRFRETTVTKAQKKYRTLMNGLNKIVEE